MDRKGEKDVGKMENRRSRSAFVHFLRQKAGKGRAVHFGGAGLYLQRVRRKLELWQVMELLEVGRVMELFEERGTVQTCR